MILKSKNLTGQPLEDARELIHSEHRKSSRMNHLAGPFIYEPTGYL